MLFLFCGLLDFCCPKIPFYWEPIFHLVFRDRVFFYFEQFLNKILYFKSVMSSGICLPLGYLFLDSNDEAPMLLSSVWTDLFKSFTGFVNVLVSKPAYSLHS